MYNALVNPNIQERLNDTCTQTRTVHAQNLCLHLFLNILQLVKITFDAMCMPWLFEGGTFLDYSLGYF